MTFEFDAPAVQGRNRSHNRETQPRARQGSEVVFAARAGGIGAIKAVEHARQMLRRDARSAILHRENRYSIRRAGANDDLPAARRVAQRVGNQIGQGAAQQNGVGLQAKRFAFDLQRHAALVGFGFKIRGDGNEFAPRIEGRFVRRRGPVFGARQK